MTPEEVGKRKSLAIKVAFWFRDTLNNGWKLLFDVCSGWVATEKITTIIQCPEQSKRVGKVWREERSGSRKEDS